MTALEFQWYEFVNGTEKIAQGDILFEFSVPTFVSCTEPPFFQAGDFKSDVIVMTQACDLQHRKVKKVTVCPLMDLNTFIHNVFKQEANGRLKSQGDKKDKTPVVFDLTSKGNKKKINDIINKLKSGYWNNLHLLNQTNIDDEVKMDAKIVRLKETYQLPIESFDYFVEAQDKQTKRIRLLPPYREHLAQAYANVYGRIGLPQDIQADKVRTDLPKVLSFT